MYNFIEVIKFNNNYFEDGDVVVIAKIDGTVIVGSIMIGNRYGGFVTDENLLVLDTSEKYLQHREFVYSKDIQNIQKVK